MYKKLKLSVLLIALGYTSLQAQYYTNSPYSYYGLGDITNALSGQNTAMGHTSTASAFGSNVNFSNPASYQSLNLQSYIFDISIASKQSTYKLKNNSFMGNSTNLQYISSAFKATEVWAASFGLMPYSSSGYDISASDTVNTYISNEQYSGSGGLNKVYFGNSFKLHKFISVGVNASYYFGSLTKSIIRRTSNTNFSSVLGYSQATKITGFQLEYGIQSNFNIGSVKVIAGAVYGSTANLKAFQTEFAIFSSDKSGIINTDTITNESTQNDKSFVEIPRKISAGLSVIIKDKITLTADYTTQNWVGAQFLTNNLPYNKYEKIAAGFEYVPKANSYKYREIIRYRFGGYLTKGYLNMPDNNGDLIQPLTIGGTIGLGLPMKTSFSGLNISLEAGQSNLGSAGLSESFYLVHVNLALRDMWFIKRKYN